MSHVTQLLMTFDDKDLTHAVRSVPGVDVRVATTREAALDAIADAELAGPDRKQRRRGTDLGGKVVFCQTAGTPTLHYNALKRRVASANRRPSPGVRAMTCSPTTWSHAVVFGDHSIRAQTAASTPGHGAQTAQRVKLSPPQL